MNKPLSEPPPPTPEELQRFVEFLYHRTGMQFAGNKRYYIDRRISDRQVATARTSFADYLTLLRNEPRELEALINAFTVNETYFYREEHQFRCMSNALLPELVRNKTPGDKVRIWSVPCSTGEEAFSIAIWLLENWPLVDAYNIEIVGSDIDTSALAGARVGEYRERALAQMPPDVVDRYFDPAINGARRIIKDLEESVSFTEANLIDAETMMRNGVFDLIFCRNVLIYFDDASRRAAASNLRACLAPGGFLCLGHSEAMSRISDRFDTRPFPDAVVYQRPASG